MNKFKKLIIIMHNECNSQTCFRLRTLPVNKLDFKIREQQRSSCKYVAKKCFFTCIFIFIKANSFFYCVCLEREIPREKQRKEILTLFVAKDLDTSCKRSQNDSEKIRFLHVWERAKSEGKWKTAIERCQIIFVHTRQESGNWSRERDKP